MEGYSCCAWLYFTYVGKLHSFDSCTIYRVVHSTGLSTKDENQTLKYDDLKLDFWFPQSIEYFDGLINIKQEKSQFWPTRNPECIKMD